MHWMQLELQQAALQPLALRLSVAAERGRRSRMVINNLISTQLDSETLVTTKLR